MSDPEENWESYSAQYASAQAGHIDQLRGRIDPIKLCFRASSLRQGIPCTVDLSRKRLCAMMGGQNCHGEIIFDDNVTWLARFRLPRTSSQPSEARAWILRNPTPEIFDWACESDPENPIGADYILMEKLDGKPLTWKKATPQQKEKVMQQLASHISQLARLEGARLDRFFPLEGSKALLESYLAMIANGEIDSCCPVDTYLVHRFRQYIVGTLSKEIPAGDKFFLKHPDDKGDHILVNDRFDIVGIIDWEWTRTVSKAEAFSSPCTMWPVAEFYTVSNKLSAEELQFAAMFQRRAGKILPTMY
ncbi:hypothetical protein AJ79_07840 [Helicocarpus griseus UAMH5409]|uniref:Aminoglycoside phosphotransferase domain-containing protein n=1 Tax=Helicocarpus griseus UAMH5409 TaxID=1447875 RepID=A0A2B7WYN8_9EURO|nr:hypothetical protein AJ79_07840 [Helicocarpus griseus UAMH5409]